MYQKITAENPYEMPMRIYPAVHYTMGGLWVDYNLMSNVPGLHVLGEANFSDHGANRLGASALMQGLADGYFVIPYTLGNYLANETPGSISGEEPEFAEAEAAVKERIGKLMGIQGTRSVDSFHKALGKIMWDRCGMARNKAGLEAGIKEITELRKEYWQNVRVLGESENINTGLEKAGRVADFLEFGEVMCRDALAREESCGGHFREEHQTSEGEAKRNDDDYCYVSVWGHEGEGKAPSLHKEKLTYENIKLSTRSYK
jgi:succinate dehydrogenase / fumarate reductase flavoprotein subunit